MTYYTKKPVTIEARVFDSSPESAAEIIDWASGYGVEIICDHDDAESHVLRIPTLEGVMTASPGDVIIRGLRGEFYPCKPDIFAASYDNAASAGHEGLPVKGYKPQGDMAVAIVNRNKLLEERVLRQIETIGMAGLTSELRPPADPRWLAVARTRIEQGFMALNRAVFQPGRVALPEDDVRNFDGG